MAPNRVTFLERQVYGPVRNRFRYVFREAETREIGGAIDTDQSWLKRQIAVDNRKGSAYHNPLENGRGASLSFCTAEAGGESRTVTYCGSRANGRDGKPLVISS